MSEYVYTGVKNTNGNRYDVTIDPEDFMQRVDMKKLMEEDKDYYLKEILLNSAVNPSTKLEHVDTYLTEENEWRVQLRLDVDRDNVQNRWNEISRFMQVYEQRRGWCTTVLFHPYNGFYGVITFKVPCISQ